MFTGLVECLAEVLALDDAQGGRTVRLRAGSVAEQCAIGDSVAVNGCCLTVVRRTHDELWFEAGPETLARTNLGRLKPGALVNLERSLRLGDRLGGHLVTGHIDALGTLESRRDSGPWSEFWFTYPPRLAGQLASKGSIAVDGVSLTLVDVEPARFSVALIPHTLSMTTLGPLAAGDPVNLETDLLAKYIARQLELRP